jgi:phosphatidylglycerophosphate synthase
VTTEAADARSRAPAGEKALDYWWTVLFTDPLAVPLTRVLARTRWISPNAVSVLALLLGLASGVIFAFGTRVALVAGGVTFYFAFLVDCIDGKLARALNDHTRRGAALDHIGDTVRRTSASLGLTAWLWRATGDATVLWSVGYMALAYMFLEFSGPEIGRERWELLERRSAGTGRWRTFLARHRLLPNPGMPDVQALAFIVGPVTGWVIPALVAASVLLSIGILRHAYRLLR